MCHFHRNDPVALKKRRISASRRIALETESHLFVNRCVSRLVLTLTNYRGTP